MTNLNWSTFGGECNDCIWQILTRAYLGGECNGDIKTVSILTERQVFIWERACFENNMDQQTEYFCSGVQREEREG